VGGPHRAALLPCAIAPSRLQIFFLIERYEQSTQTTKASRIKARNENRQPIFWEFLCGYATMSSSFERRGWQTFTVDSAKRFWRANPDGSKMEVKPSLQTDILHLTEADIKDLAKTHGKPDSTHFAPPCSPRSRQHKTCVHYLNNMAVSEEAKRADACVIKCFFIIAILLQLNPALLYSVENPMYKKNTLLPCISPYITSGMYCKVHYCDYDCELSEKKTFFVHNNTRWKPAIPVRAQNPTKRRWDHMNTQQRTSYPPASYSRGTLQSTAKIPILKARM
jgi:hypothetical protein